MTSIIQLSKQVLVFLRTHYFFVNWPECIEKLDDDNCPTSLNEVA